MPLARPLLSAAALLLAACQPQVETIDPSRIGFAPDGLVFGGGDGSSQQNAVVMPKGIGDMAATKAEYEWIRRHRPGWTPVEQALLGGDRYYDMITISKGGKTEAVFFDITDTLGVF